MHSSLKYLDHRPWPIPENEWGWRQNWTDLLFAHWQVDPDSLNQYIPDSLEIDSYDNSAWIGVVPFRMENVSHRYLPDLPYLSKFPELNLRTYVRYEDKPGVWFFSLDAANLVAVKSARSLFHLPYKHAKIELTKHEDKYSFNSKRLEGDCLFNAHYQPVSEPYSAETGTLEHWLTERYCLYAESPDKTIYRTEVHHAQWSLEKADAEIRTNQLADNFDFELPGQPVITHFSKKIEVIAWSPEKISDC